MPDPWPSYREKTPAKMVVTKRPHVQASKQPIAVSAVPIPSAVMQFVRCGEKMASKRADPYSYDEETRPLFPFPTSLGGHPNNLFSFSGFLICP